MIKLYENIRYLRKENKWSQDELAQRMGYKDRSSIAKIESGMVDIPRSKILEFAKVFGVSPGDLMGWEDDKPEVDYYIEGTGDIIEAYNKCSQDDRKRLLAYARLLAGFNDGISAN